MKISNWLYHVVNTLHMPNITLNKLLDFSNKTYSTTEPDENHHQGAVQVNSMEHIQPERPDNISMWCDKTVRYPES